MTDINSSIERVLFSKEEIAEIVGRLGAEISRDYADKRLLMVGVLKGSVMFLSDLLRKVTIPCEIDFITVSSYGNKTSSDGNVKILKKLSVDIKEFDVLVVEDILDTGSTLTVLKTLLEAGKPQSIKICTFFDKPERRKADIKADYCGTTVPDEFIVGYGLDFNEKFRNLPYVGVLKPECYEK